MEMTENKLKYKAEAYCSGAERCPAEVNAKLQQWGADKDMAEHILNHLEKERYIDTVRFCRAFVRDKYRFSQWGRMKIAQALRMKQLPQEDISAGLAEIDEAEYAGILRKILLQKLKSIKSSNGYERKAKLIRFAAGRGFTMDEILAHVNQMEADEYTD